MQARQPGQAGKRREARDPVVGEIQTRQPGQPCQRHEARDPVVGELQARQPNGALQARQAPDPPRRRREFGKPGQLALHDGLPGRLAQSFLDRVPQPRIRNGHHRGRGAAGGHGELPVGELRRGREVGKVSVRASKQAHDLDGLVGGDVQVPLARAVAEAPVQVVTSRFERPHRDGARRQRPEGEPHGAFGRLPPVVQRVNLHRRGLVRGVGDAELADLRAVAPRVEERHVVEVRAARGHQVAHARQEAGRGADVGVRLDVEGGGKRKAPVPRAVAHAAGQPLGGVAVLEVA